MTVPEQPRNDAKIVRAYIDSDSRYPPTVVTEAELRLNSAMQHLADLGLTPDEVRKWVEESFVEIEWEEGII